jgi:hypothetical protein
LLLISLNFEQQQTVVQQMSSASPQMPSYWCLESAQSTSNEWISCALHLHMAVAAMSHPDYWLMTYISCMSTSLEEDHYLVSHLQHPLTQSSQHHYYHYLNEVLDDSYPMKWNCPPTWLLFLLFVDCMPDRQLSQPLYTS